MGGTQTLGTWNILKLRCLGLHKKDNLKTTTLPAVSSNRFADFLWKPTVRNWSRQEGGESSRREPRKGLNVSGGAMG